VHLLGNIRSRIVDNDRLGNLSKWNTQSRIVGDRGQLRSKELGREGHVDEARSGDLDIAGNVRQHSGVDDFLSQLTRIETAPFG